MGKSNIVDDWRFGILFPALPRVQMDILTGCVVTAHRCRGCSPPIRRTAYIMKPYGLEERGGADAVLSYVHGIVCGILDKAGIGIQGMQGMLIRVEKMNERPQALKVTICYRQSITAISDLHVRTPRNTKGDEDVPDELENLPRRVDPSVLGRVIVHANVADELGPRRALGDVCKHLDPGQ